MSFDERLEKITERVDAIAQSVELLARMQVDGERHYQERFSRNEERLGQLMDSMNRLVRIVEIHEHRLDNLG